VPKLIAPKLPLPTLWVDTAIGIKLAKTRRGEAIQSIEKLRVSKLKDLVVNLVRSCKLLCPEGEQEWEYGGERLEEGISGEFAELSRGIRMLSHQAVHDAQTFIAMTAHVNGDAQIELPARIYFRRDPIEELRTITQQSVFVSVHGLPPMLLQMNNETRRGMYTHSEDLRRKNVARGRTYDEQLTLELRSFVDSMADFARSFKSKLITGRIESWEYFAYAGYERYFQEWHRLTGKFADWEGLGNFFISDYFYKLPAVRISSQLHAKLVTDNRPTEPGDSMDVKHLSLAIPLAQFVLTDRKMANRIMELGIDKEWDTRVFSESTIDDLFAELECI
jgi:hypothetical protein